MLDWTKIQEECPNALIEWAKSHLKISDKAKIKLSPADAAFAARRLKDEDIYAMPGYFDKLGIFIKTEVYWGANDENHCVEISIRNGDTLVCDHKGNWSENLSHKAYIHIDRLHAIAVGVDKAFRIHESQLIMQHLERLKNAQIEDLRSKIEVLRLQRNSTNEQRINAAIDDLNKAILDLYNVTFTDELVESGYKNAAFDMKVWDDLLLKQYIEQ